LQYPLPGLPDRPNQLGSTRQWGAGPSASEFGGSDPAHDPKQLPLGIAGHELRPGASPYLRPPSDLIPGTLRFF